MHMGRRGVGERGFNSGEFFFCLVEWREMWLAPDQRSPPLHLFELNFALAFSLVVLVKGI